MKKTLILMTALLVSLFVKAQDNKKGGQLKSEIETPLTKLILDFPILDMPFMNYATNVKENAVANFGVQPKGFDLLGSYRSPSMEQSTQFSNNIRYALFFGAKRLANHKKSDKIVKKALKYLLEGGVSWVGDVVIPFGEGWQHEEFHRATMTRAGFFSNNSINDWITGRKNANNTTLKSVNSVLDSNLVILKSKSNADFVRLHASGGEGEIYSGEAFQRNNFYNETGYFSAISQIVRFLSVQNYINTCSNKTESTQITLEAMKEEGNIQSLRDFTGLDFSAWAYDLFNPTISYSARGKNPYGNGYDRYIYGEKLTTEQYDWLKKQSNLAWINLISPMNLTSKSIVLKRYADGSTLKGNFALRYYPTSFGNQIGMNILLKKGKFNWLFNPAINQNYKNNFPSMEAQLIDYQLINKLKITGRVLVWTQPENQDFFTKKSDLGGLVSTKVNYVVGKHFEPYVNFSYKTKGWVAGNVFLNQNFDVKMGFALRF